MAEPKASLSDAEALSQARDALRGLAVQMEDTEVRSSFYLLSIHWQSAARKARRRQDYGRNVRYPVAKAIETFHVLDEDRRALCLAKDVDSLADGEFCADCAAAARQLDGWGDR